ncbi:MAG: holo-ACP synthase [Deltaproteobacteria bacterium]|nr:holo-ACP synthase [Deltaproteobacteria bacterium]MBN2688537.1 holo-ACP synthase [Deltaproteobacteria bacterium]
MIHGIGIDIVDVKRIDDIIGRWGETFLRRVYSREEIDYCAGMARASMHFAARFAAKEAFLKCIGVELRKGISLRHISVDNKRDGSPVLRFQEEFADRLFQHGITKTYVSLSHTDTYATAVVILEEKQKR